MLRLFDFDCDTCGIRWEKLLGDDEVATCPRAPACAGVGAKRLGGRPALASPRDYPKRVRMHGQDFSLCEHMSFSPEPGIHVAVGHLVPDPKAKA